MSDSTPPEGECPCGAYIIEIDGVWVDIDRGPWEELCYPHAAGIDGDLRHEELI